MTRFCARHAPLNLFLTATACVAGLVGACGGKAVIDDFNPTAGSGGASVASSTVSVSASTASSVVSSTASSSSSSGSGGGAPGTSRLVEIDLGAVDVDTPTTFNVTNDTIGFAAIVSSLGSPYAQVGVQDLVSPSNEAIISGFLLPPTTYQFAWFGTTTAGVPQSENASAMPTVEEGLWSITVDDFSTNEPNADVHIWRREAPGGVFDGGYLDVNVFVAGMPGAQNYLPQVLDAAFTPEAFGGLRMGETTFYDVDESYAVLDDQGEWLDLVLETKVATKTPALNLMVVADMSALGAAGIAAGIPGQGIEHGTLQSAVTIILYGDVGIDSAILRHETGHLSGLFHTTEIEFGQDPFDDTPSCADVENQLQNCPDAGNVMFPVPVTSMVSFSAKQERVLQGSTLYRGDLIFADGSMFNAVWTPPSSSAGSANRASAPRRNGPPSPARWRDGLDARAAHLLEAHWCGHRGPRGQRIPHLEMLDRYGVTGDQLLAVGQRSEAPDHVRQRALIALGRRARSAAQLAALEQIAATPSQPWRVRVGALRGLERAASHQPARARAAAQRLRRDLADGNRIVADVARAIAR